MKICSPMSKGNGAFIVHQQLASFIEGYSIHPYHQNYTLFPFIMPLFGCKQTDVIHTTADYGIFFSKHNTPLVLTLHNYVLDNYMSNYSSLLQNMHYKTDLKLFTRLALRKADRLTAVSHYTANLVKQDMDVKQDIRVIYNGIDESVFVPFDSDRDRQFVNVLFSGNISKRKGFNFLQDLLPFLNKNIRLLYTSGLRANESFQLPERGVNLGSIPHADMPALYQNSDILVFPSVREGFGLSVAEAMSCGLPIVAFNTSSLPELIDHDQGGYLTEVNDVEAFADYVNLLAEDRSLRKNMGQYNREKIRRKFTLKRMVDEYRTIFEEVADLKK